MSSETYFSDSLKLYHQSEKSIRVAIRKCQKSKHDQQVAFSTYHDCLTQICFSCGYVRTSKGVPK